MNARHETRSRRLENPSVQVISEFFNTMANSKFSHLMWMHCTEMCSSINFCSSEPKAAMDQWLLVVIRLLGSVVRLYVLVSISAELFHQKKGEEGSIRKILSIGLANDEGWTGEVLTVNICLNARNCIHSASHKAACSGGAVKSL